MKNWVLRNIDYAAGHIGDNMLFAVFLPTLVYGHGVANRDPGNVVLANGYWALLYVALAPYLVRRVAIREPPQDPWRAAALVACGALPFFLFIPFWSAFTAWPASLAVYPAVALWSCAALLMAAFGKWPRGAPQRRMLYAGGSVIFAVAAGPAYLGFMIFALLGAPWPPDLGTIVAACALLVALPFAGLSAVAAVKLFRRAGRPLSAR